MARRLKTIATWIDEHCDGLHAHLTEGFCNTDSRIAGTRLRRPGKGRRGTRLIVQDKRKRPPQVVLDHNSAETYRNNDEVERWLARWCVEHPTRVKP